jgi:hypothetical protein
MLGDGLTHVTTYKSSPVSPAVISLMFPGKCWCSNNTDLGGALGLSAIVEQEPR